MRVGPSRVRANRGKSRDGRYDTAYCNVRSLVFAFVATVSRLRGPGADPAGGFVALSCPACVGSATFLSPSRSEKIRGGGKPPIDGSVTAFSEDNTQYTLRYTNTETCA